MRRNFSTVSGPRRSIDRDPETIKNGTFTRTPQDHSKATYVTMMTRETGLIDWNKKRNREYITS